MSKIASPPRLSAHRLCLATVLALLALQWAWPGRVLADYRSPGLASALVFSIPLAVLAWGLWRKLPTARFWSGVAALFYFCHGIAEAWAVPATWLPGLAEALLSTALVLASSWEGLRARLGTSQRRNV